VGIRGYVIQRPVTGAEFCTVNYRFWAGNGPIIRSEPAVRLDYWQIHGERRSSGLCSFSSDHAIIVDADRMLQWISAWFAYRKAPVVASRQPLI
jgi:hypothetical protein